MLTESIESEEGGAGRQTTRSATGQPVCVLWPRHSLRRSGLRARCAKVQHPWTDECPPRHCREPASSRGGEMMADWGMEEMDGEKGERNGLEFVDWARPARPSITEWAFLDGSPLFIYAWAWCVLYQQTNWLLIPMRVTEHEAHDDDDDEYLIWILVEI